MLKLDLPFDRSNIATLLRSIAILNKIALIAS